MALRLYWNRLGSKAAAEPTAQLRARHLGATASGLALAAAAHGSGAAAALGAAIAFKLLVDFALRCRLSTGAACAAVWALAAAALGANAALEGGSWEYLAWRFAGAGGASAARRWAAVAAALDRAPGLAPAAFSSGIAFRYTLMRLVSYGLDRVTGRLEAACNLATAAARASADAEAPTSPTIRAVRRPEAAAGGGAIPSSLHAPVPAAGAARHTRRTSWPLAGSLSKTQGPSAAAAESASWPALLAYVFFPATLLCGPILTASDFMAQMAALEAGGGSSGKRAGTAGLPPGWRATVGQMLAWATALELAKRSFLADGFILSSLAAQPWHTWALAMGLLQALFLQSWIPWTVARLAAAALGVRVPDEAPLHWLASSASVRAFWRSFHAYVYHPFGGGTWATLAVLFVSSCLHGARGPWLTWGAIQSCAILAERAAAGRAGAVPPLARAAAGQAAALSTLLVQLPLAPSLTSQLAWFLAVGAPFFLLNAARLRRQAAAVASEVRVGKLSVD
eukprot:scaffold10.g2444.t1